MTNTKAHEELLAAILLAYRQQHPLPDSDLDDEQPVALSVRTTLGHLRALELEHLRALERLARAGGGS